MKRELRERRDAVRARMKALRRAAQARVNARPESIRRRRRKRIVEGIAGLGALLLLLLIRCDCGPPHVAVPSLNSAQFRRRFRIADLVVIKIDDADADTMFYFAFT